MILRYLKDVGIVLGKILVGCFIIFAFFMLIDKLLVCTFPEDYLFYENQKFPEVLFVLPAVLFANVFVEFHGDLKELWKSHRSGCIAFLLTIVCYICYFMTSVTFVTPDTITSRTLLNPMGTTYKHEEIEKIETGFGANDGGFFAPEYQKLGNFYYKVYVGGREIVFHVPSTNSDIERYTEDTYLELEEFDQKLVTLGIPKEGNPAGSGLCDYDDYYVDRFLRIIGEN